MAFLSGYNHRLEITTDHTKVGEDLTNFPVLASLAGQLTFNLCDPAGLSVRITDVDNNILNFERESHDYANGTGAYHFKAPTLHTAADDIFYLYYKTEQARWEQFLTQDYIESDSGVAYSVNRPTKYGSNPIFGNAAWTWDRDVLSAVVLTHADWPAESAVRMWYQGVAESGSLERYTCYAYSSWARLNADPTDWTKPVLGQVTYDGDTDNNIIALVSDRRNDIVGGVTYDSDSGLYILTQNIENDGDDSFQGCDNIYTSSNPTGPWTLVQTLPVSLVNAFAHLNGFSTQKLADGRWLHYTQCWDNTGGFRSVGAYISDTDALDGDWTDLGVIIPGAVISSEPTVLYQIHSLHISNSSLHGGLDYGQVLQYYDGGVPQAIELHVGRGGTDWYSKDTAWISLGAGGAWDDAWLYPANSVLHNPTTGDWWVFYVGGATTESFPFSSRLGLATIGYQRVGQVAKTAAGEGYVISKPISSQLANLYINFVADGAGDKIEIELLDASDDSVITDYAQADCTDLTGDSTSTEVVWGSNHLTDCPVDLVKIKFYLTKAANDVKLHTYTIGSEANCLYDSSVGVGTWDDDYLMVSHMQDNDYLPTAPTAGVRTSFNKIDKRHFRNLTKKGAAEPTEIAGAVALAQDFDGSNDYAKSPHLVMTTAMWQQTADFTFMCYYAIDGFLATAQSLIGLGQTTDQNSLAFIALRDITYSAQAKNRMELTVRDSTNAQLDRWITPNDVSLATSGWVALKVTSGVVSMFVNGVEYAPANDNVGTITGTLNNNKTIIGSRSYLNVTEIFDVVPAGIIDEVRLSDVARSDNWLIAEYNSVAGALQAYDEEVNEFTLTYTAGANGSISGDSPQTVALGEDGTAVEAVPDEGYHFVKWSDDSTDNPRTDTNIQADLAVEASFAIDTFTLEYTAGDHGSIDGTTPQTVDYGADGTAVEAIADSGYEFEKWSDDSTDNPRTDTNVVASISVSASFTRSSVSSLASLLIYREIV